MCHKGNKQSNRNAMPGVGKDCQKRSLWDDTEQWEKVTKGRGFWAVRRAAVLRTQCGPEIGTGEEYKA